MIIVVGVEIMINKYRVQSQTRIDVQRDCLGFFGTQLASELRASCIQTRLQPIHTKEHSFPIQDFFTKSRRVPPKQLRQTEFARSNGKPLRTAFKTLSSLGTLP